MLLKCLPQTRNHGANPIPDRPREYIANGKSSFDPTFFFRKNNYKLFATVGRDGAVSIAVNTVSNTGSDQIFSTRERLTSFGTPKSVRYRFRDFSMRPPNNEVERPYSLYRPYRRSLIKGTVSLDTTARCQLRTWNVVYLSPCKSSFPYFEKLCSITLSFVTITGQPIINKSKKTFSFKFENQSRKVRTTQKNCSAIGPDERAILLSDVRAVLCSEHSEAYR